MSLLRICAAPGALGEAPLRCQWALLGADAPRRGEGPLAELPRAKRVELVLPASQVLITRVRLPRAARRRSGSVLAFAVEEVTAADPDASQVSWLGATGDEDALAVVDRQGLARWRDALNAAGIAQFEVRVETLMLPRAQGEWSVAWNGREGFVRTGEIEGAATDEGHSETPPLSLRMMLEQAASRGTRPAAIALYTLPPGAPPDLARWAAALGVPLRLEGPWDWRAAPIEGGAGLAQERRPWRVSTEALARLRPAAWIAAAALTLHAVGLVADWAALGAEQRDLRRQMEARFRAAFPEAVAVADPVLQMRRQLALARHRAGLPDSGDFTPMIENVASALKELPAGGLRTVSYESGRMALELVPQDEAALRRLVASLGQTGLVVDAAGPKLITVRAQ